MLVINVNRKVALVLLAILAVFFAYSFQYPPEVVAFPRFLLAVLTIMTIGLFIRPGDMGKVKVTAFLTRPKLLTAAFMVAYVALFPFVGFFVTTFLTVFLYILTFERKAWWKALLIALGWVALLYGAFQTLLYIWFPQGLLI
ncbi:MAG: tripartite tricarboxylate transporter TctB family protein [Deltaproteobacteria bacterium]|nr:tripartite tricarboxylate transporter TctB family protein [Deltaproteobacteria bacterium]